jgi:glycosyltransferase involved in cell wall biosynthesis
MNPLKVAIVANPFAAIPPKGYGGIELVVYYLIKGLKELGHQPILLGTGDSKVDVPLVPIVEKAMFFPQDPVQIPPFRKWLDEVEARTTKTLKAMLPEIDVIHSHGYDTLEFAAFPNLYTLHNPFNLIAPDFKFTPLSLEFFEERKQLNYVSISDNQREGSPDLNYVATVYNGEDTAIFPFVPQPQDYVCFLGRFDPDKNPHLAIELALKEGISIKLAGKIDFKGRAYFNQTIRPYLSNPKVEYLGELGFKEKVKLLSKARANLHPTSFREPFGLTVVEAAYCGTPTLAIERGALPELIKDGVTGKLVEDFVEGAHQLEECFEMDRRLIAERARRKFNYQRMSRNYVSAYKKVIKRAGR